MLNFKDWEKTSEDKKTTTLKHPKGHSITLVHSKLPKIQQEALKRLKMADGGMSNTGGSGAPESYVTEDNAAREKAFSDKTPSNMEDKVSPQPASPPVVVNVGTAPQGNQAMAMPVQSPKPVPVQQPNIPQGNNPLLPNGSMNAPAAAQNAQSAAKLGTDIEAAKAAAAVPQEQQYLNQTSQLNQNFSNNINDLQQKANDFDQWHKANPLKENAYLENMGAGKKIGTALGLLLSGAGAGLSGQPNMAMEFLNKQIDRNIQAQKDRFGQQNTVWSAYKDLYQNEQVADQMARVHALDMLTHQASLTAAQLGTPAAAAHLLELKSKLAPERNKLILDSAGAMNMIPMNNPNSGGSPQGGNAQPPAKSGEEPPQASNNANFQSAYAGEKHKPENDYADSPILNSNAQDHLDTLRYTPKAKEEMDQIKGQYTAAQQADTILSQLHPVMMNLHKDALQAGKSGYLRRHNPVGEVPVLGPFISSAALQPLTDTQVNRDYDANRTRIVSDIANALKGSNISGEEIDRMVRSNAPEKSDTPEMVATKERNIRTFIKNNVNKSLLKDWGLAK
jgi:hypothetical protein